jgi:hypothetical protein
MKRSRVGVTPEVAEVKLICQLPFRAALDAGALPVELIPPHPRRNEPDRSITMRLVIFASNLAQDRVWLAISAYH